MHVFRSETIWLDGSLLIIQLHCVLKNAANVFLTMVILIAVCKNLPLEYYADVRMTISYFWRNKVLTDSCELSIIYIIHSHVAELCYMTPRSHCKHPFIN